MADDEDDGDSDGDDDDKEAKEEDDDEGNDSVFCLPGRRGGCRLRGPSQPSNQLPSSASCRRRRQCPEACFS